MTAYVAAAGVGCKCSHRCSAWRPDAYVAAIGHEQVACTTAEGLMGRSRGHLQGGGVPPPV